MPATLAKEHLSIVICGHVDIGESTTTARLNYDLGGLPQRELEKLKEEAVCLVPGPIAFTFYMDRQKEEHECGVTSASTTQDFYTEKWHYTVVIDAPGHRNINKVANLQKKADNVGWWKSCNAKYGKDGWYKDFEEKETPVMPVSGRMGDYLLTKSDNMDWWKECVGEYGKARATQNIHHKSGWFYLSPLAAGGKPCCN
ncbi:unnamed protein product [Prorocentrum cordatum]|uniref:Tr-type G domain-containing protein n=1 Tax=Prorocentrum cordatum TaxID=2364126 RepID=A0ABN9VA76_9DINO|nr:unnamed protein product [Polarella glacialis]